MSLGWESLVNILGRLAAETFPCREGEVREFYLHKNLANFSRGSFQS